MVFDQGPKETALNDADTVDRLRRNVGINLAQHRLATEHFSSRQYWVFAIPQAVLTLVSTVLAFLATTSLIDDGDESDDCETETPNKSAAQIMTAAVGVISAVVFFLQTISAERRYGKRATMHDSAAISLRNLREELKMLKTRIHLIKNQREEQRIEEKKAKRRRNTAQLSSSRRALSNVSSANLSSDTPEGNPAAMHASSDTIGGVTLIDDESANQRAREAANSSNYGGQWDSIEAYLTRHKQFQTGCKSDIPLKISGAYIMLESDIRLLLRKANIVQKTEVGLFYDEAYDTLWGEFLDSFGFPFFLPNSKKITKATCELLSVNIEAYKQAKLQMQQQQQLQQQLQQQPPSLPPTTQAQQIFPTTPAVPRMQTMPLTPPTPVADNTQAETLLPTQELPQPSSQHDLPLHFENKLSPPTVGQAVDSSRTAALGVLNYVSTVTPGVVNSSKSVSSLTTPKVADSLALKEPPKVVDSSADFSLDSSALKEPPTGIRVVDFSTLPKKEPRAVAPPKVVSVQKVVDFSKQEQNPP